MTAIPRPFVGNTALWRLFLWHLGGALLFNIVCAAIVTYVIRVDASFWKNLVFSMYIGTLMEIFLDGGRLLLWGQCKPPALPFFSLLAVSVPAAYFLGTALAAYTLGIPQTHLNRALSQYSVSLLIFTLLVSLLATWLFWSRGMLAALAAKAEAEKARAAAIEKQAVQAQLQLLQAQIEPHMLFNTLANLQGMIALDPARAQHMLDQLIQYLRATLTSSRAEKTTLAHEFALMEAYLGLMSVRMGARLSCTLQLPDALRELQVPPMLLQPLVENAIRHGLEPKIGGGRIDVRAQRQADMLQLSVADTGLGLDANAHAHQPGHATHLGLCNVRERLQALYGERAALSLAPNTPTGVIAQLNLPIQP